MSTCALVIGHSKNSPGASNADTNLYEFEFNDKMARQIHTLSDQVDILLVYRKTYRELPDDINKLNPDFILSLHCNAFNRQASGTQVLYYHRSSIGKTMAELTQTRLRNCLGLRDRGIEGITSEDRGGYLVRYTRSPCIIAEPFFIDNNNDLAIAQQNFNPLCFAYIDAINDINAMLQQQRSPTIEPA